MLLPAALLLAALLAVSGPASASGVIGKSYEGPYHAPEPTLLKPFLVPNTYFDRPRYRYPYYDTNGHGKLLYGYGGSKLYRYSIFRPIEGYFK